MLDFERAARTATIYGLMDPVTHELKYVGKAVNPRTRLAAHINSARLNARSPKDHWLNSLTSPPVLVILGTCSEEAWPEMESRWIALARDMNGSLTNTRDGGEGRVPDSDSLEHARFEVNVERLVRTLGKELVDDLLSVHMAGFMGLPGESTATRSVMGHLIDRLSDADRVAVEIRALAKASSLLGGADSGWAVSKWQPIPQYFPHQIRVDASGQQVAPGLPPLRFTRRTAAHARL